MTSEAAQLIASFGIPNPDFITTNLEYHQYRTKMVQDVIMPEFYTQLTEPKMSITIIPDTQRPYRLETDSLLIAPYLHPHDLAETKLQLKGMWDDVVLHGDYSLVEGFSDILHGEWIEGFFIPQDYPDHTEYFEKQQYLSFLHQVVNYESHPDDFVAAYHFLDNHPAFWIKNHYGEWSFNNNYAMISVVLWDDNKKPLIGLEHGAGVPDARTSRYHDTRLDLFKPTYEEAVLEMASRTHKLFTVTGLDSPQEK